MLYGIICSTVYVVYIRESSAPITRRASFIFRFVFFPLVLLNNNSNSNNNNNNNNNGNSIKRALDVLAISVYT